MALQRPIAVSRKDGLVQLRLAAGARTPALVVRIGELEHKGRFGIEAGVTGIADEADDEVGITTSVASDADGGGIEIGMYMQETTADTASRAEAGATVRADRSPGQAGLDVGAFTARSGAETNSCNRLGTTVNADISPGQFGLDVGFFREEDYEGAETGRIEGGVTVNAKLLRDAKSVATGQFFEDSRDARKIGRTETGVRLNMSPANGVGRPSAFVERTIGSRVVSLDRIAD